MPEIGALLHHAVPPEGDEPDLEEIAHLAGRRRRRRRTGRVTLSLAVVVIVASGLSVLGGDGGGHDIEDDTVILGEDTTTTTDAGPTGLGAPSPSTFAHRLGTRPMTATSSFLIWPLTPEQFFDTYPPDQAVVGTLAEVRPGPLRADGICRETPNLVGCADTANIETVVEVERWLGPAGGAAGRLAAPWQLSIMPSGAEGAEAEQANRLAAVPYQEAAPIGARVLVLLRVSDDGSYAWIPSAVSAIVIEDGGGVAVPHNRDFHQPIDFDDYVAEVEELLR